MSRFKKLVYTLVLLSIVLSNISMVQAEPEGDLEKIESAGVKLNKLPGGLIKKDSSLKNRPYVFYKRDGAKTIDIILKIENRCKIINLSAKEIEEFYDIIEEENFVEIEKETDGDKLTIVGGCKYSLKDKDIEKLRSFFERSENKRALDFYRELEEIENVKEQVERE